MGRLKKLFTPRQIMFMDMQGRQSTRRLLLRPGIWLIALIALLAAACVAGWFGGRYIGGHDPGLSTDLMLHNQITDLRAKLAESETTLQLRENEMQGVRAELEEKRTGMQSLQEQVNLYKNVMEAGNKARGVRILRSDVAWKDSQTLTYDILLVRGGTYRWGAKGHIRITVSGDGHEAILNLGKGGEKLPYRLETHTFLRGNVSWPHDWRPQRLVVDCLDPHGKVIDSKEIALNGDNA
ncbi:MAG: DUF6776 family protein [Mariprofundaceae bacterium]